MKKYFAILIVLLCIFAVRLAAAPTASNVSLVIQNALASQAAQQAITQSVANAASGADACPFVVKQAPAAPQEKPAAAAKKSGLFSLLKRLRFW